MKPWIIQFPELIENGTFAIFKYGQNTYFSVIYFRADITYSNYKYKFSDILLSN